MKSILLISHGSRHTKTVEEIKGLVGQLRERSKIPIIEYAFLEIAEPDIPNGIDNCVKQGASEVIILLNFLNSGKHVDEDIPGIAEAARKKHSEVKISITKPLGMNNNIIDLFLDMINDC